MITCPGVRSTPEWMSARERESSRKLKLLLLGKVDVEDDEIEV
jgi:hypothetical protein